MKQVQLYNNDNTKLYYLHFYYGAVTRYILFLLLYNVLISGNTYNELSFEQIITITQSEIIIENIEGFNESNITKIYKDNAKIFGLLISHLRDGYNSYIAVINSKLQNINFAAVTNVLQCVLLLAYFEIIILKLLKAMVIADYLTIINVFNFTKKEIGFTNKIIDLF